MQHKYSGSTRRASRTARCEPCELCADAAGLALSVLVDVVVADVIGVKRIGYRTAVIAIIGKAASASGAAIEKARASATT